MYITHTIGIYKITSPSNRIYIGQSVNIKERFKDLYGNNKIIITTEKDIMRLSLPKILNQLEGIPIFYIPIEICFHGNDKEDFEEQILKYVTANSRN